MKTQRSFQLIWTLWLVIFSCFMVEQYSLRIHTESEQQNIQSGIKALLSRGEYQSLFKMFDSNNSGSIQGSEINYYRKLLADGKKDQQVFDLLRNLNKASKPIKLNQFVEIARKKSSNGRKTTVDSKAIFKNLDKDGNGSLDQNQFNNGLKLFAQSNKMSVNQILQMLKPLGIDLNKIKQYGLKQQEFQKLLKNFS